MSIIITELDKERLERVLAEAAAQTVQPDEHLEAFRREFKLATVVPSEDVPADVVTMNSTVDMYDMEFDVTDTYTIVYPINADIFSNRLSILNPMGMAVLGRRQGEIAQWQNTNGEHQLKLMKLVFQPEREGAMNL